MSITATQLRYITTEVLERIAELQSSNVNPEHTIVIKTPSIEVTARRVNNVQSQLILNVLNQDLIKLGLFSEYSPEHIRLFEADPLSLIGAFAAGLTQGVSKVIMISELSGGPLKPEEDGELCECEGCKRKRREELHEGFFGARTAESSNMLELIAKEQRDSMSEEQYAALMRAAVGLASVATTLKQVGF